ncbi:MAG: DUF1761 family protein [Candidatus Absconditabacterales bacterium]
MNPITSLLISTDWRYVITCTIVSILIGFVRFHDKAFGKLYRRWMKFPKSAKAPTAKEMAYQFGGEVIARLLYFLGIGQIFQVTGRESMSNGLILAVVVYCIFVLPAQISQVSRSLVNRKVLWLLVGKGLLETFVATVLRYAVF